MNAAADPTTTTTPDVILHSTPLPTLDSACRRRRTHHVRIQKTFLRLQLLYGLRHALLPHRDGGQPRHPMPVRSARIVHTRAWQLSTVYSLMTRPAVCLVEVTRPSTSGDARGNRVGLEHEHRDRCPRIKKQGSSSTSETPRGSLDENLPTPSAFGVPTTRISRQLSTLSVFLLAP